MTGVAIDSDSGLLISADYRPSPNCNDRPPDTVIDLVVVHGISLPPGRFGGPYIDALFTNRLDPAEHPYFEAVHRLQVSAHLLIRRNGQLIQYVPFHRRAWHAGQSSFCGRNNCNDFAIGIELEGTDTTAYTDIQYRQLAEVITALQRCYPNISRDRITGHADIAPGRKTDPGPSFNWPYLHRLLDRL